MRRFLPTSLRGGTMCVALSCLCLSPVVIIAQENSSRSRETRTDRDDENRFATRSRDNSEGPLNLRDRENRPMLGDDRQIDLRGQAVSASGRVTGLKRVGLRGTDAKHVVVMLETGQNRRGIVDLGAAKDLRELKLQRGDRISVKGNVLGIGDRRVLMADQVSHGEQTVEIDRTLTSRMLSRRAVRQSDLRERLERPFARAEMRGDRDARAAQRQQQTSQSQRMTREGQQRQVAVVRGTVEKTKVVKRRNTEDQNLVALVRQENDRVRVVDLGAVNDRINQERINEGDQLMAMGDPIRVGDRRVLLAQRVQINGNQQRVDRNWPNRQSNNRQSNNRQADSGQRNNRESNRRQSNDRG